MTTSAITSITSRLLYHSDAGTALGRQLMAGYVRHSQGLQQPRVFGRYALVYLLNGSGWYWDAAHGRHAVRPGDVILVFPDIGHTYGPGKGRQWTEFYCVFDGPAFDLLRAQGVLDPARPLLHLEPLERWLRQLEAVAAQPPAWSEPERLRQVSAFLHWLIGILSQRAAPAHTDVEPLWLSQARGALETNLDQALNLNDVAGAAGLAYESFRKQFQRQTGISPARYRAIRRIEAARAMLQNADLTLESVASQLGFTDAFHLSRRFKQHFGLSPRAWRRGGER